jgi:hypothetical protein
MDDAALKAGLALVPEVYKDLLQPGVRQLGIALETVVGVLPTVLPPLEYVNKAAQLRMGSTLHQTKSGIQRCFWAANPKRYPLQICLRLCPID